jgi:hypothetical protein
MTISWRPPHELKINFPKVSMYLENTKISFYINEKERCVISVSQCTHKKSAEAKAPCAMAAVSQT